MEKHDIGILTFWSVPNYGTFAQAYALQKVIGKICRDKDVRQIAHLDKKHRAFYYDYKSYMRAYPFWKKNFWRSFFSNNVQTHTSRENLFVKAYSQIPHTFTGDLSKLIFDKVFIGSDIVWDYSLEPFNRDPMLFGFGLNSKSINSYGASFGTVKQKYQHPQYVIDGINNMRHISVRDENSADIVEMITGKRPPVVLDPTWLWDFQNDALVNASDEDKYILIYGQDFTNEFIKNLVSYSKKNKLKTVVLDCNNVNYDWCDKLIKQDSLEPLDWIGYFKEASAVATSTFHGITLALIFNKKIAFCKTDFIMNKIDLFLKQIGVFDLFNDKNDVQKMLNFDWDYDSINAYINQKRKESLEFLRKACDCE